jgi:signal-transduction protein with cAMP-binding, CBS, and nucleotidyltransferase domain
MELNEQDIQFAQETIKKMGLFSMCSEPELGQLMGGMEKQNYKQGSTILFQGEISSRLYIIESGKVSVTVRNGKIKTRVAELETNNFFGEISLLTPRAATATIKAEADTVIIFLPGEVVQRLAKENIRFQEGLNHKINERLASQKQKTERKPEQ